MSHWYVMVAQPSPESDPTEVQYDEVLAQLPGQETGHTRREVIIAVDGN